MWLFPLFAVRQDLTWGVPGKYEIAYHVVESQYIYHEYRVGVVTATSAYVIRPSLFDVDLYRNFTGAPDDIRHVDDIWLSGQAARRRVARYIVPSCCAHIGVTRTHVLENYLNQHQTNRFLANSHALVWFRDYWENDLWYKFNGVAAPNYRSWLTAIYRQCCEFMLEIRFFISFGIQWEKCWHHSRMDRVREVSAIGSKFHLIVGSVGDNW